MSYTVKLADICTGIAALSITGVKIRDITKIPASGNMVTPIMFPMPDDNFITGLTPTPVTYGTGGLERMDLDYDLNYVYAHCPIAAALGGPYQAYASLIVNVIKIIVAIMSNDNIRDGTELRLKTITKCGPVTDPAGNQFWGCALTFHVKEYLEVA